eukprot:scaffold8424_cov114-Phaeocystis_antarctica.AAC.5
MRGVGGLGDEQGEDLPCESCSGYEPEGDLPWESCLGLSGGGDGHSPMDGAPPPRMPPPPAWLLPVTPPTAYECSMTLALSQHIAERSLSRHRSLPWGLGAYASSTEAVG